MINKIFVLVIIGLVVCSCNSSSKNKEEAVVSTNARKIYDMYEPSEMAILMNEFYAINENIKQQILKGETPTEFSDKFLKIHTAELSSHKDRNETFEGFSRLFVETEKQIFNESSDFPIEDRYNNAINLCVSCHQTQCTGPIPRIKKLLIK